MKSFFKFKLFALLLLFVCVRAQAQPTGIHLSWNGNKPNTSATIALTWMNSHDDKGTVAYGTDSLHLDKTVAATVSYVAELTAFMSKATVKNLRPATIYYYKVGSIQNGWSAIHHFRTGSGAGNPEKFVVGVWSDTQNNGGNYNFEQTDTIVKLLSGRDFNFTIHNGDIVENGSIPKNWKGYFSVAEPVNAYSPLMSVTGNHDVVNDTASPIFQKPFPIFYELMNLPANQLNYSYDYDNTHFVAINSGWAEGAAKVGKVLFEKNSDEYKWLEKDLKKARKNKKINWIIIYSHYPVYSFGFSHIPLWQAHIKPLVDKYKVDLYLAGHRHVYERHKAICGTQLFEPEALHEYVNPKGTVYITNGSCGGNLTGTGGEKQPDMIFTPKNKIYTYAIMTIEGKKLQYEVFNKQGEKIDYFTISKQ